VRGVDCGGDFAFTGERDPRRCLPERRIEHVAEAAATPGNFPAADEVVDFLQDRRLIEWLVHSVFPFLKLEFEIFSPQRRKGRKEEQFGGTVIAASHQ